MKAVILGAGKSTRTQPLTITKPKPLLTVANKTIIEHALQELKGLVDEVVIIVGYKKEMIQDFLGEEFEGLKITYVEQREQNGTGGALLEAKEHLTEKFLVLNGDDIFFKEDIERCLEHDACILVKEVEQLHRFGEAVVENGKLVDLIEKPEKEKGLANTGLYVFSPDIFEHELEISPRGELEITEYVQHLIKQSKMSYEIVQEEWISISYPWNLLEANEYFLKNQTADIQGEVEEGATIKGEVVIGEGTIVKSGAYIEGPVTIGKDCVIGPNCYIRPFTSIDNNSNVGNGVDVKNSIIGKNSHVAHLAYVGDSVIGDNVNVAAGVLTANLRHDKENIKTPVKGELTDTGRKKLGAIIADDAKLAINTSIYPGRKIWPGKTTLPGDIVTKDITE